MPVDRTLRDTTRRVISFPDKYAAFRHVVSLFSFLPALRGLWTANHLATNGDWEDWTKYDLLLTAHGTPTLNCDGLASYVTFDGATDYFSRADDTATSITGTLTCGAWLYTTSATTQQTIIGKWTGPNTQSYLLSLEGAAAGDPARLYISDDGTNYDTVDSSGGYSTSRWHFVVGRFNDNDTGEELAIWLDNVKAVAATARASIFDSAVDFTVGALPGGGQALTGRMSVAFLCAFPLPDDMIGALFQQSRALYGV